ncbi:hypothetical protein ACJIZ3_014513 [Penstemon smallii]|uniref:Uncharacterized protein n=1 Tax=Penstemon smallii TaxID=265156 RepID=A0ABD3RJS4_9LAMI
MAVGLPFVPPYKNTDAYFRYGVNFAVAASKNIFSPVTTSSLNVQLEWMSNYFNSICLKNVVISLGATRMVVAGNFPIGCLPIYQTTFQTKISDPLKQEKSNAIIIYRDYYNAYQFLHRYANSRGTMCGAPDVPVCSNPNGFMSWNEVHLTQEGYKIMVEWLVHNIFRELEFVVYYAVIA